MRLADALLALMTNRRRLAAVRREKQRRDEGMQVLVRAEKGRAGGCWISRCSRRCSHGGAVALVAIAFNAAVMGVPAALACSPRPWRCGRKAGSLYCTPPFGTRDFTACRTAISAVRRRRYRRTDTAYISDRPDFTARDL